VSKEKPLKETLRGVHNRNAISCGGVESKSTSSKEEKSLSTTVRSRNSKSRKETFFAGEKKLLRGKKKDELSLLITTGINILAGKRKPPGREYA